MRSQADNREYQITQEGKYKKGRRDPIRSDVKFMESRNEYG